MMHRKLTASGVQLAAVKVTSGRGSGSGHPPKKVGLDKWSLAGRLVRREADDEEDNIMGDIAYRERKGGPTKARKGLAFTLRAQT